MPRSTISFIISSFVSSNYFPSSSSSSPASPSSNFFFFNFSCIVFLPFHPNLSRSVENAMDGMIERSSTRFRLELETIFSLPGQSCPPVLSVCRDSSGTRRHPADGHARGSRAWACVCGSASDPERLETGWCRRTAVAIMSAPVSARHAPLARGPLTLSRHATPALLPSSTSVRAGGRRGARALDRRVPERGVLLGRQGLTGPLRSTGGGPEHTRSPYRLLGLRSRLVRLEGVSSRIISGVSGRFRRGSRDRCPSRCRRARLGGRVSMALRGASPGTGVVE